MRITKEQIDQVKQRYPLVAVIEAKGIALKKQGKQYMGRCPFHEDKKPSLSVDPVKGLFHCFGCGAGGDVLGFLSRIENKPLPTLLKELTMNGNGHRVLSKLNGNQKTDNKTENTENPVIRLNGDHSQSTDNGIQHNESRSPKLIKLFQRVVKFYQDIFTKDLRGQKYLEGRGIKDPNAFRDFGVGYANGSQGAL